MVNWRMQDVPATIMERDIPVEIMRKDMTVEITQRGIAVAVVPIPVRIMERAVAVADTAVLKGQM